MRMSAISCHHALATIVSRSAVEQASLGARRHAAAASLAISTTPSTSSNHRRRHRLVSRAAIDIPPYALVHPEATKRSNNNNNNIDREWGIEPAKEGDNKVKLWFKITGVGEVKDEVEVNLPLGSNVLTIKKKKKATKADERLDVRLLLTEDYDMAGIEVKGKKEGGKVHLEINIVQKTTSPKIIDIN